MLMDVRPLVSSSSDGCAESPAGPQVWGGGSAWRYICIVYLFLFFFPLLCNPAAVAPQIGSSPRLPAQRWSLLCREEASFLSKAAPAGGRLGQAIEPLPHQRPSRRLVRLHSVVGDLPQKGPPQARTTNLAAA
ncbi:hypothetical protein NDU88_001766 [Pleurodeles waltl]|uniref:Uncharacterized protein n=1 Tax=Pleurodeles waltl TaxID=8319 RepID=A0AAV7MMF6_PLEWA|nr:hypothetical protein NDU88_001766 [Pleurodeles waltl]